MSEEVECYWDEQGLSQTSSVSETGQGEPVSERTRTGSEDWFRVLDQPSAIAVRMPHCRSKQQEERRACMEGQSPTFEVPRLVSDVL